MKILKKGNVALAALLCSAAVAPTAQVKLHTIGDSTMQTYDESSTDKRGWSQMLQQFFNSENIKVNNRGKAGASSKSFYNEAAYWPTLNGGSDCIKEGDFVVIQFAHNDEKTGGTDGDELKAYYTALGDETSAAAVDYRGTTPFDTYKSYLRKYIEDTKALGGKPILVGPICRKYFSGNTIKRNGRHDLGDSFNILEDGTLKTGQSVSADDHKMDYVYQMQQVAAEYDDVPFIDLTTATAELYISYGDSYCTSNLFVSDDSTHPAAMGATLIARLFAQLVKTQAEGGETDATKRAILQELADNVVITSEISFSPSDGDLGQTYAGQTLVKEFNVSAFGLDPAAGTFTFTVDGDFTVSTDKSNYSNEVTVDYTGATLIAPVYVRAEATSAGTLTGKLTATNGSETKSLDLSATAISIADGTPVSVVWPLTTDATATVTGPITALDETWSGCYAKDYNAINKAAVWTDGSGYDATHKVQRNCIEGNTWPSGEMDEVSTRYIQFGVQAPADSKIAINKVFLYVAGAGGSGMRCKIYYSTDETFSSNTQIIEFKSMAGNTVYEVEAQPVLSIKNGESFYLRIYPWYSSEATGKTICFSDVTISGVSVNADEDEGQEDALVSVTGKDMVGVAYYDLNGRRLSEPAKGVNIVRTQYSDGSIATTKLIK